MDSENTQPTHEGAPPEPEASAELIEIEEPTPEPEASAEATEEQEQKESEPWSEEFSPEELAELFGGEENVPARAEAPQVLEAEQIGGDDEDDEGTSERLQKLLSRSGVASRRAAEELILAGRVTVNGGVVMELGRRARADKDVIAVDGRALKLAGTGSTVVVLYKPRGCVTTKSDPQGRATVMKFLPKRMAHLHPVGRLDFDTSGVLLLTDDGGLTNLLLHPSHGVEKRYHARVRGQVSAATIDRLQKGISLEDGMTAPCRVRVKAQTPSNALLEIVLREGRNRQVRRMLQAVGHPVSALRRVRLGPIDLGGLVPGGYRELLPGEVHLLKKAASAPKAALKSARPFAYKPRPSKAEDKTKPQVLEGRSRPERSDAEPERRPNPRAPRPDSREARPDSRRPGSDSRGVGNDSRRPGNDSRRPGNDSRGVGNDSRRPGSDSRGVGNDSRRPGNDSRDSRSSSYGPRNQSDGLRSQSNGPRSQSDGSRNESNGPRNQSDGLRSQLNGPRNQSNGARSQFNGSRNESNGARGRSYGQRNESGGVRGESRDARRDSYRPRDDSRPDARREERGGGGPARPDAGEKRAPSPANRGGSKSGPRLAKRIEDRWK